MLTRGTALFGSRQILSTRVNLLGAELGSVSLRKLEKVGDGEDYETPPFRDRPKRGERTLQPSPKLPDPRGNLPSVSAKGIAP